MILSISITQDTLGLKQVHQAWYMKFSTYFQQMNFQKCTYDTFIYVFTSAMDLMLLWFWYMFTTSLLQVAWVKGEWRNKLPEFPQLCCQPCYRDPLPHNSGITWLPPTCLHSMIFAWCKYNIIVRFYSYWGRWIYS